MSQEFDRSRISSAAWRARSLRSRGISADCGPAAHRLRFSSRSRSKPTVRKCRINQVANVTVPEPRMLSVSVWDKSMVSAIEKAIRESTLGLNPMTDGTTIRVPLPELNEERRRELVKIAHQYAENARIAVRHVRRDGMETLKRLEKDGEISQDDSRTKSDDVQKQTDQTISRIDSLLAEKESEIMQV